MFIATILLLFIPSALGFIDTDGDTIPDERDLCPESTPDFRILDAGLYAQNDIDSPFERGPENINSEFTMVITNGCTCLQIAGKLGIDKNTVAKGCSSSMIRAFVEPPTVPSVTGAVSYGAPRRSFSTTRSSGLTGLPLLAVIVLGLFLISKIGNKNNKRRKKK